MIESSGDKSIAWIKDWEEILLVLLKDWEAILFVLLKELRSKSIAWLKHWEAILFVLLEDWEASQLLDKRINKQFCLFLEYRGASLLLDWRIEKQFCLFCWRIEKQVHWLKDSVRWVCMRLFEPLCALN